MTTDTDKLRKFCESENLCPIQRASVLTDEAVLELLDRIDALEAENFALAASQCVVDGGLVGDEHGHAVCTLQHKKPEPSGDTDKLIAEIDRLYEKYQERITHRTAACGADAGTIPHASVALKFSVYMEGADGALFQDAKLAYESAIGRHWPTLRARLKELKGALEPFAKAADEWDSINGVEAVRVIAEFALDDLRRARAALKGEG